MFRPAERARRRLVVALLAAGLGAVGLLAGPTHAADEVAAFLERLGATELLAVHLEQRLEEATGEERDDILLRLASMYAEMLGTVRDPVRRVELEERARNLLKVAPDGGADELRLALLRATFQVAERTAEEHRLRQAEEADLARASELLGELVGELNQLRRRADDRVELLERRLARATGSEATVLARESEQALILFSESTFLAAWAMYYQSWLAGTADHARVAQELFEDLLDFGDQAAVPENVSVDLRSTEAIARCILGLALCRSLTTSPAAALSWLDLLDHEETYTPLRAQRPAWEMAILLEHEDFRAVRMLLSRLDDEDREIPVLWLRLLAVHAIEASGTSRTAAELATKAVTDLASRSELEQVYDLARRYGADALGTEGFAPSYVAGVLAYRDARAAHGNERPTGRPEIADGYAAAAAALRDAIAQPDAGSFADAARDAARFIAWCEYFRGRFLAAADGFEAVEPRLPPGAAAEALWMSIVCLDELVRADPAHDGLRSRLDRLVVRFLDRYPSSEHAPKLVLRRALREPVPPPELVDELLSIPPHSEVYGAARRRAAQLLYRLFREGPEDERAAHGTRYLSVALALQHADEPGLETADEIGRQRFLVRGRRILEVALSPRLQRLGAAKTVLASIDAAVSAGWLETAGVEAELAYRRTQERLLAGDLAGATRIADALRDRPADDMWANIAARAMLREGMRRRRAVTATGGDDRVAVALIVKFGPRVLARYADDPDALADPRVLSYAVAVAEASFLVWDRSHDRPAGDTALRTYERLLEVRPRNASFLRAAALLSERLGRPEFALACWRKLVAGTPPSTDAWFEAKFNLVNLLAMEDEARARLVLEQHRLLNPDFGPLPWGPRFRALDRSLPPAPNGDAAPAGDPADAPGASPDAAGTDAPPGGGGGVP